MKLPLVTAVKDKIAACQCYLDNYSEASAEERKDVEEQFRQAYMTEYVAGCCPDAWLGDAGILDAIIDKFRYVLEVVEEEAIRRTNTFSHHLIVVVEPCYYDSTFAAILHDAWNVTGKKALCWFQATKPGHFCWNTETEMEEAMEDMVSKVVETLKQLGVVPAALQGGA